jgi:hypothetical protein
VRRLDISPGLPGQDQGNIGLRDPEALSELLLRQRPGQGAHLSHLPRRDTGFATALGAHILVIVEGRSCPEVFGADTVPHIARVQYPPPSWYRAAVQQKGKLMHGDNRSAAFPAGHDSISISATRAGPQPARVSDADPSPEALHEAIGQDQTRRHALHARHYMRRSPNTSAAWTVANVSALEAGTTVR